jgi:membrane protein
VNRDARTQITGASGKISLFASLAFLRAAALPMSILMLSLVYWILPNRELPARHVIAPAILVGVTLELLKYVNVLAWPWPFAYSVTIILWSFLAAMVILAGAEWPARSQTLRELWVT